MRKREITPHSPLGLSSDVDMDALVDDMEPPSSPIESPSKHISLFDDLEMADDAFESSDPQTQAPGGEEGTDGNGRSRSHRASTADTVPVGDKGHEQLLVKLSVDPVNLRALLSKGQEADGSGDVLQEDVSRSEASKTGSAPVDELPTTTNMDEDEDELSAEKLPAAATAGLSGNEPLAVGLSGTMQADKAAGLDSVGMPMDVDGEQHHERPTQITASERDSSPSDDKKTTEPRAAPQPIADTAQSKVVDTPGQETASSENIPEPPEVTHVRKSGRTRKAAVPKGSYTCSNDPRPPMAGSKRHERTEEEGLDSDKTTKRRRTSSAVGDDAEMEDSEGTAVTDQLHRETVPPAPADEPLASSSAATTESRSASAIQALSAPAKRNGSTRKQKKLASTSTSTAASAVAKNKPSAGSGIKSRPDPKTKAVEPKTKAGNSVAGAAGRNKPSGSSRTNSKADPKGPGNGKITRRGKGSKA